MIEPGRGGAYAILFSEIGFTLLVTTLVGVGVGYWADTRLGTIPIFVLIGFFVGNVMKATQGKANPAQVNEILKKRLAGSPPSRG